MNHAEAPSTNGDPTEQMDRVREILFGAQARSFASKLDELELRIQDQLEGLRRETREAVERLGGELRRELSELEERQRSERKARTDAMAQLGGELHGRTRGLEERLGEFEDRVARVQSDTRRDLEASLHEAREEARTALERSHQDFEGRTRDVERRKLERTELALALTDIASRLAGTAQPVGSEHGEVNGAAQVSEP